MTAAEWNASHNPDAMLVATGTRLSDQILLRFLCECARQQWATIPESLQAVIPRLELAAELLTREERQDAVQRTFEGLTGLTAAIVHMARTRVSLTSAARQAAMLLRWAEKRSDARPFVGDVFTLLWENSPFVPSVHPNQAALLRCVAGNPFADTPFRPAWRTSDVLALATTAATTQDVVSLPILADALQDAGCDDEEMLTHLRGDMPHARKCWVLERILANGPA